MRITKNLKISRKQLGAHKLRTLLALFGIIIGVTAVVVMVAIGRGAQSEVLGRIEAMGTNLMIVSAGQVQRSAGRQQIQGMVSTLTLQDQEAILRECPAVKSAAPLQSRKMPVKYGPISSLTTVVGTTPEYFTIRRFQAAQGDFFSAEENKAVRRVAVLGPTVARNLFSDQNPLGQVIRVGRVAFTVIGVTQEKGVDYEGLDQDDQLFIPIRTGLRRLFNLNHIASIHIEAQDNKQVKAAESQVKVLLRERHNLEKKGKPDDFTLQNQIDLLDAQQEAGDSFTMLIGSIAAVSLLVGGVGILAVMLLAVRERTPEIGLRMAVGASRRDILLQFIAEAGILGLFGGTAGAFTGIITVGLINLIGVWQALISIPSILLAFSFSLATGMVFGVFPARKASLLNPIESLRSE